MQVNSVLERMRKLRQEKAAAAAAAAAGNGTSTANISTAASATAKEAPMSSLAEAGAEMRGNTAASPAPSSTQAASVSVPVPPPVFASPSSARLNYRDSVADPLCTPFTSDLIVPVLQALLQQPVAALSTAGEEASSYGGTVEKNSATATTASLTEKPDELNEEMECTRRVGDGDPSNSPEVIGKMGGPSTIAAKVITRMQERLHYMIETSGSPPPSLSFLPPRVSATVATPPPALSSSLFGDIVYNAACAAARVDVAGATRPISRDVHHYTRINRISQGVYGVVFRAIATRDYERQRATASSMSAHCSNHHTASAHHRTGSAGKTARTYALKHIKKMWLEESQTGFPPYLMREIDLLLRLKHPNITDAIELVLLDPTPQPRRLASSSSSSSSSSRSSSSSSSSSSSPASSAGESPRGEDEIHGNPRAAETAASHAFHPSLRRPRVVEDDDDVSDAAGPAKVSHKRSKHEVLGDPELASEAPAEESGRATGTPKLQKVGKSGLAPVAAAPASTNAASRPLAAVGAQSKAKDVFLVMEFCPYDLGNYMRRYGTVAEASDGAGDGDAGDPCSKLLRPGGGSTPSHDKDDHHHRDDSSIRRSGQAGKGSLQAPFFHITPRNTHPLAGANYVARAKSILVQLLRAVGFLHENRILHRDLKTSNVLVAENGYVKVCDFGLGRLYREGQVLTPTVVTLMYRAPELHFGVTDYSHKMDVWSLGCIFAELFLRRPLFHASTDSHHLLAVCDILGIPSEETFPGLYHLPQTKTMMQSLPRWNRVSRLAGLFCKEARLPTVAHGEVPVAPEAALLPPSGIELLSWMLQWNPRRRPSAAEALAHPFFREDPLPCAPAELTRPMPWRDAVSQAGYLAAEQNSAAVYGQEEGRPPRLERASKEKEGKGEVEKEKDAWRASSSTVPPPLQMVADPVEGTETSVSLPGPPPTGVASPAMVSSPNMLLDRHHVTSADDGCMHGSRGSSREESSMDRGDLLSTRPGAVPLEEEEESRDVQLQQLHTRHSTRDLEDDDAAAEAAAEKAVRQAQRLANEDRDE